MSKWQTLRLDEIGRIVTGKTPPTSEPRHYGGKTPFVTPSDMDGRRTIDATARTLTTMGVERVRSSYIADPAISVSCIGSDMGKAALINTPFVSNQQINSLIPQPKFDRLFVYYNLSMRKEEIRHKASGAAQPIMNKTDFGKLVISIPELSEQRAISGMLTALDDKIELNRRMNETLEAQARALFRDWFVDFGPVKAKMADPDAGGAPYLAPELWSLFPNRLDDDGVPEGWDVAPLDEIAEFLNGLALQKYPAADGEDSFPVIKIAELRTGPTSKSNRASTNVPKKYVIGDGDFIFSWSGSLLAKFWTHGPGALNQHLFKVTSDEFPPWFYSHWVWHHLAEFQLIAASKATTMGHIKRGHLKDAMCVVPSPDLLEKLSAIMEPLVERTIANELESRTLAQTRDLLLPKLMSGEIRVGDVAIKELSAA